MARASHSDVVIVGAGIAGLATAVFLRQAGVGVVCVDAAPCPHDKVGESLDWSSPGLLTRLGIDCGQLIEAGVATFKRKIAVSEQGRQPWTLAPPPGIRRPPLRFETVTLHVDRTALDARAYDHARALGATFVWDRVASVEVSGDRVTGCLTARGKRLEATWYVDASGTSRVFARSMGIPATTFGPRKVCLWAYFDTPPLSDGTSFFLDNRDPYLSWVWDIPIAPGRTSIGVILRGEVLQERRRAGQSVEAVFREALSRHSRWAELLERAAAVDVRRTSYQAYVSDTVCGTNWLMVGEAASMPDPLTGNGVTSGIRHAVHAATAIHAAGSRAGLTRTERRLYDRHVQRLGRSFNAHIERVIYRPDVRWGFGMRGATYVYTLFAFFMNAVHARLEPSGRFGTALIAPLFLVSRMWIGTAALLAGTARLVRRRPLDGWS